jgi:hypothetical protein
VLVGVLFLGTFPLVHAQQPQPGAPASDVSNIPKPITDTFDRVNIHGPANNSPTKGNTSEKDDTCLLSPLNLIESPTIALEQLRIAGKARKEYQQACSAIRSRKIALAERHLHKAVQQDANYSLAWVTLGQVLAAQQKMDEARSACFQGTIATPSSTSAYLCLADIAAHAHAWDEVLKLTGPVIELEPSRNFLAYEYDAAANLNLRNLDAAEKSGLRAAALDKNHHEPRVQFVLAQIYEAKRDATNEAAHLREFLKYADNPDDVALAQQYLSKLDGKIAAADVAPDLGSPRKVRSVRQWGPPDIDAVVPPVRTDTTCPLPRILQEASRHSQDFLENLQRFSANERIDHIDVGKDGKRHRSATQVVNYVAQIEENSSGYPTVKEYRYRSSGIQQPPPLVDTSTAAFALIFHPTHIGNFDFQCEGLTELQASPAWQVRFEERDETKAFHAMRFGRLVYLPRFKGRAWITTDTYQILRIETDLVSPVPQIDLRLEHLAITYAPVEFQKRHLQLWLPESASLFIEYRGHRYERRHDFSDFQLFWIDTEQTIKEPPCENPQMRLLEQARGIGTFTSQGQVRTVAAPLQAQ